MFDVTNSRGSVVFWSLVALATWMLMLVTYFQWPNCYFKLGAEDDLGENLTSAFYFLAGFLLLGRCIARMRRNESHLGREVLPILLGLFFVFVGGEEISWGQRLMGIATPELVSEHNLQNELTLHNLKFFDRESILNQHTALNFFALMMGIVIPMGYRFVGRFRRLMDMLNFPVLPLSLTMWFVAGIVHGQTIAKMYSHYTHTEVKELIFSIGFILFGVSYFREKNLWKPNVEPAESDRR